MITAEEARERARALIHEYPDRFRYEFIECRIVNGTWSVVFSVFSEEGNELDGPVVVIVDPMTGAAHFLSS